MARRSGCWSIFKVLLILGFLAWLSRCVVNGVGGSWFNATRWNEEGIRRFQDQNFPGAAARFEKSAGERVSEEVPIHNRGCCHLAEKDYAEAHRAFEQALEVSPRLAEGLYNDGQALYGWGGTMLDFTPGNSDEEDPCRRSELLKKALTLWEQALERFENAAQTAGKGRLRDMAAGNAAFLRKKLDELRRRQAWYQQRCEARQGGGGGGGASSSGGGQGSAGGSEGQGSSGSGTGPSGSRQRQGSQEGRSPETGKGENAPAGKTAGEAGGASTSTGGRAGAGEGRSGGISREEQRQIESSLKRQESQRRRPGHGIRQTAPQQWRKGRSSGYEVLW